MGKEGPCYHCGVTSTPLWRNGPPEKPILCNACGSRWRTKGSLTNYTPLHARPDLVDSVDYRVPKVKSISIKIKEPKLHKRKHWDNDAEVEIEAPKSDQNFRKVLEEDTSNRSSTGSAISYSENCSHFNSADANDLTGSAQSNVWDVPSKKRTCVSRPKQSPVEKLTKDLYCILHEQQQSSYLSGSSEEDLLFESGTPMVSVEIGHGSVLIRHPNTAAREEESEASSLPVDSKAHIVNEAYSAPTSLPVHTESKGINFSNVGTEKFKRLMGQGEQEHMKRDKFSHEKLHILQNNNSPLGTIDLRDVVSFEEFVRHLTHEEQQQLMKLLPSIDAIKLPESFKSMFDSPQFVEALSSFQQLLLEGIFDLSLPGVKTEECTNLKRLALVNLTKSKWVEQYQRLKKLQDGNGVAAGTNSVAKGMLTSLKRVHKSGSTNFPSIKSPQLNSSNLGVKESHRAKDIDNDGSCFSPRSLFAFPPDRSLLDSLQFTDDSSDQDLLFDVPSNTSFPQAELLHCHLWKQKTLPNSTLIENKQILSSHSSSSLSSQQPIKSSFVLPHLVLP
ncbi:GATA transcription factor 26-like [Magnolia sinica]|uniref:GATA transcription factor 26-like n=1 Tax=Magnolia sinica TaxID=86752 RepID=UPI0026594DBB|nr:GATA transcription factor 26-like [Magnolia sinica]